MDIQQTQQKDTLSVCGFAVRFTKGDKDLLPTVAYLSSRPEKFVDKEEDLRKILLPFVENTKLAGTILVEGNSVWSVGKLLVAFQRLLNNTEYVDGEWRLKLSSFSDYLYQFLSLQCGSIAHYNKAGWLDTYPTRDALRSFFERNEYGSPVANYSPNWHYDARLAQAKLSQMILG